MEPSLKQLYKILLIIYASLIVGVVIFQAVAISLNDWKLPDFAPEIDILNIISLCMFFLIPAGKMVSDKLLKTIDPDSPAPQKMMKLQTSLILRWAFIESASLFSIVVFILLNDGKQMIVFLLCLAAFALASPSREKISTWAKLNSEERRELM